MANIDKITKKTDDSSQTSNVRVDADGAVVTKSRDRWRIGNVHWIVHPKPERRVIITILVSTSTEEDTESVPSEWERRKVVLTGDDYRTFMREDAAAIGDTLRKLIGKATRSAARATTPKLIPPAPQCTNIDETNPDPE